MRQAWGGARGAWDAGVLWRRARDSVARHIPAPSLCGAHSICAAIREPEIVQWRQLLRERELPRVPRRQLAVLALAGPMKLVLQPLPRLAITGKLRQLLLTLLLRLCRDWWESIGGPRTAELPLCPQLRWPGAGMRSTSAGSIASCFQDAVCKVDMAWRIVNPALRMEGMNIRFRQYGAPCGRAVDCRLAYRLALFMIR